LSARFGFEIIESTEMSESSQAILDRGHVHSFAPTPTAPRSTAQRPATEIAISDDLDALEAEWRRLEAGGDCTVFQSFDWLATWYRHIGQRQLVTPAVVIGRRADGQPLFLIPLAVTRGIVRRLTWLGTDLCDYNAPLLAHDFADHVAPAEFRALWSQICAQLQNSPQHRHDIIDLTKMPVTVGRQDNPFMQLDVGLNPSGAHLTQLQGTWDEFYQARRSSSTRRRDRTKRKRLGEIGEVRFITPQAADDIARTMETLIEQKSKSFAHMGVANIFTPPGHRDFYFDLATNPRTRHLVHVSRLEVGSTWAAANLGLMFGGCYYHVLASYDDGEVSRYGPGAAHLRDLLCYAIGRGLRCFDFTIGDERYKLEWSDSSISLYDHVTSASARGWPVAALTRGRRQVKRLIKQNPMLWKAFSRLRAALTSKKGAPEDAAESNRPESSAR
jgi:CelD/BcsL family acetyltransferase involved in cellulose biosynthesis